MELFENSCRVENILKEFLGCNISVCRYLRGYPVCLHEMLRKMTDGEETFKRRASVKERLHLHVGAATTKTRPVAARCAAEH